jgi:hypothetical protein
MGGGQRAFPVVGREGGALPGQDLSPPWGGGVGRLAGTQKDQQWWHGCCLNAHWLSLLPTWFQPCTPDVTH